MRGCLGRALRWTAIGIAGLLALVILVPYLMPDPGGPPLKPPRRQLPANQDGWPLLIEAAKLYDRDGESTAGLELGPTPASAAMLAWVRANEPGLAKLEQALARGRLAAPETVGLPVHSYSGMRGLARVKVQRGYLRLADGDLRGGLTDQLDVWRLGRQLADGDGVVITYLVGVACETIGLNGLANSLAPLPFPAATPPRQHPPFRQPAKLSRAERALWQRARDELLAADGEATKALQRTLAREHEFFCASLARTPVAGDEGTIRWGRLGRVRTAFLDLPHARGLHRRIARELQADAARPAWQRCGSATGRALAARPLLGYDPAGRVLVGIAVAVVEKLADEAEELTARQRGVAAQISMRLFWDDRGRLPRDWHELVRSGHLPAAPVDPFDGQPLRYDPARAMLWSIGADRRDDRGARGTGNGQSPDVLMPILFAPATE